MTYEEAKAEALSELALPVVGTTFVLIEGEKRFRYKVSELDHPERRIICDRLTPMSPWQSWWSFADWWSGLTTGSIEL